MKPLGWNPRYVAYAKAHGLLPWSMYERDRIRWPGGVMAGFIVWIGERWSDFEAIQPEARGGKTAAIHAAFDEWLEEASTPTG